MLQSLRQLLKLQIVDDEIAIVDAELAQLPKERSAIAAAIAEARAAIGAAKDLLESEELEERRLESDMREQEALLEKLTAQGGLVTSTQAYEALQHEIDAATLAGSGFETRALELMEKIDQATAQLAKAEETFSELETAAPAQLETIAKRQQRFESQCSELVARREAECVGIERELISRYERVSLKRRPAVIALPGKACPHCQMAVPAQRVAEIKRAELVYSCDSCQRLLVSPSALEE